MDARSWSGDRTKWSESRIEVELIELESDTQSQSG
jgi:hypothetical protein